MKREYNILIAEDDPEQRQCLSLLLRDAGFQVHVASDGQSAIEELEKNPFTLALLDLKLPRKNGLEVLEYITNQKLNTYVIILTAYGSLANMIESQKLGAVDFIRKPYDPEDLLHSIQRLITADHQLDTRANTFIAQKRTL